MLIDSYQCLYIMWTQLRSMFCCFVCVCLINKWTTNWFHQWCPNLIMLESHPVILFKRKDSVFKTLPLFFISKLNVIWFELKKFIHDFRNDMKFDLWFAHHCFLYKYDHRHCLYSITHAFRITECQTSEAEKTTSRYRAAVATPVAPYTSHWPSLTFSTA